jgi:hypothetical protein
MSQKGHVLVKDMPFTFIIKKRTNETPTELYKSRVIT